MGGTAPAKQAFAGVLFLRYFEGHLRLSIIHRETNRQFYPRIASPRSTDLDSTGAALVDWDGDGDLDLIVNSVGGGTRLLINDGRAVFTPLPAARGLNAGRGGTSMALGDIDGDGYPDLYVANYRTSTLMDMPRITVRLRAIHGRRIVTHVNGRPATEPDLANRFVVDADGGLHEQGEEDALFLNRGGTNLVRVSFTDGTFLDESGAALATPPFDWSLSVMFRDINQDGTPDLYVCNDFESPDRLWLNLGDGRFRAMPLHALRKTSLFSMGTDFADIDRDGLDDFVVLDMLSRDHGHRMNTLGSSKPSAGARDVLSRPQYSLNTLFLNRGDGTYAEIGQLSGVAASDWSWAAAFIDVDLDGYEDLLITNGVHRDGRNLDIGVHLDRLGRSQGLDPAQMLQARRIFPKFETANVAFHNRGNLRFEDVSAAWGFEDPGISHGIALADLDQDGDLDVVINNLDAEAGLYRNESDAPRLMVRLKGASPNTRGIGARIEVLNGSIQQGQEIICGGRFLSCDDAARVFAIPYPSEPVTLRVRWPGNLESIVPGATANRLYEIDEATARAGVDPGPRAPNPLFEDVSALINHRHVNEPRRDVQHLLPNAVNRSGPGVGWFDVNRDGWEDLILAGGRGGRLAIFENNRRGGFVSMTLAPFNPGVDHDQTTVLGWLMPNGRAAILGGSTTHADGLPSGGVVRIWNPQQGGTRYLSPTQTWTVGPLALADADADGDLDLIAGGSGIPGRYPEPASALLLRQVDGTWKSDPETDAVLSGLGMINGATWSDLNGDGYPELLFACEWGPIRVFQNERGRLVEATAAWGLEGTAGLWKGLATGDFNGDGRPDFIATNWGLNNEFARVGAGNVQLFYGDFDRNGTVELLEAYTSASGAIVPFRRMDQIEPGLPFVRARFNSYSAYGQADVPQILGGHFADATSLRLTHLASMVFINEGGRFSGQPLPIQAQFAPAFGIGIADFNGDGREDAFLAQNFFGSPTEVPRQDAGCGLLFYGDGRGGFTAVSANASGIRAYGEQRGCAVSDFDRDGRVDLVVGQYAADTKLFHNRSAAVALRVRLKGTRGNPDGIGAAVRLIGASGPGPMREVQAGSGYSSQGGSVQVMALSEPATGVWVRWPGGKETVAAIEPLTREIIIAITGQSQCLP